MKRKNKRIKFEKDGCQVEGEEKQYCFKRKKFEKN